MAELRLSMVNKRREFETPRMHGGRFKTASIPVDVLPDLAAYRELVVQVAKEIYKSRNGKKAVPKGFVERFQLRLSEITEGSARPHLVREYEDVESVTGEPLDATSAPPVDEFEEARDLIAEGLVAFEATGDLPQNFPRNVIPLFNGFGKRLRYDESIELRAPQSKKQVLYTPETRKRLVLLTSNTYSREVNVTGTVVGMDRVPLREFRLATEELGVIPVRFPAHMDETIASAWRDHSFIRVQVVGFASFNRKDAFVEFDAVPSVTLESDLREEDVQDVESRLREFESLEQGWLDGEEGEVPSKDGLKWARGVLLELMASHEVPLPYLYPTPEGGVQAEWSFKPWEISVTLDLVQRTAHLHATEIPSGQWQDADVAFGDEQRAALAKIATFIREFDRLQEAGE